MKRFLVAFLVCTAMLLAQTQALLSGCGGADEAYSTLSGRLSELERAAAEKGLTYVRLGGSIGTLVNGAGLAMATMDAIKQAGAEPANFLDAGGGASEETVAAGFSIMLSDPHVRGILINIFGGILRCDIVAHGIVNAARKLDIAVPLVVRLEGTNVAEGRRILQESGLRFHTASSMSEAARLIVGLAAESPQEAGV